MFYSAINRFFKYGIEGIDVLQFDYDVLPPLLTIQKAKKSVRINGRACATLFQPTVDYFENATETYDGFIIFTDGWAPVPKMSERVIRKTLWICSKEKDYYRHHEWMKKHGKCCWIKNG